MSIEIYTDLGEKINYRSFIFSGGEVSVKLVQEYPSFNMKNSDDIMLLLNLTDAIRRQYGFEIPLHLYLNYCPYARQDRVCDEGEAFGLKVFANLINSLNFEAVHIIDPHSDVAPALINNSWVSPLHDYFDYTISDIDYLISPDAGANKKVFKLSQELDIPMIRADKVRDVKTGKILETIVYADDLTGKRVMIIDDICDGGRTFIELAKQLINKGTTKIYMLLMEFFLKEKRY